MLKPKNRNININKLVDLCFKLSDLSIKYSCNFNVLEKGRIPKQLGLKSILSQFIEFRKITIKNKNSINLYEIEFEKQKSFIKKIPFKFLHLFVFLLLLALIGINHYFYNENFAQKFYSQNYPHVANNQSKDLSSAALIRKSGISYISSLNKQKNIEQLNLNIKFNDWQYIKKRRDETISYTFWKIFEVI